MAYQYNPEQWEHVRHVMDRSGPMATSDFIGSEALEMLQADDMVEILVVGAGGLGCELLKDLALSGFRNIHVIDMDTIDVSNLNRQFLFRSADVGKPKAEVAAAFINKRIKSANVTPHFAKIEEIETKGGMQRPDGTWYRQNDPIESFYDRFAIVIAGLDSIVARRWINSKLFSMVQYNEAGEIEEGTSIPMVDGGTEGFKGQARVILPGKSSCIECTLSLYPPQKTFPMCTLATRPRVPEHCIEYIKVKIWGMPVEEGGMGETKLDGDNPAHIKWITEQSQARANEYGITGVTYRLTQGVVKNIIPAVASTNAVIAAACAHEALKITTGIADKLDDYMMWNDGEGIYNMVFQNFKPEACSGCTRNASIFESSAAMTLFEIVESLKEDNRFQMKKPGLIAEVGGNNLVLYLENMQHTHANLQKTLAELGLGDGQIINVTDPTQAQPMELKLQFE